MANNTQERNDRDFRNRCNATAQERVSKLEEQTRGIFAKVVNEAKRARKKLLAQEIGYCFFATAGIVGLSLAEAAGLISAVLTDPVCAIAFVYIGWHFCNVNRLWVHK